MHEELSGGYVGFEEEGPAVFKERGPVSPRGDEKGGLVEYTPE